MEIHTFVWGQQPQSSPIIEIHDNQKNFAFEMLDLGKTFKEESLSTSLISVWDRKTSHMMQQMEKLSNVTTQENSA